MTAHPTPEQHRHRADVVAARTPAAPDSPAVQVPRGFPPPHPPAGSRPPQPSASGSRPLLCPRSALVLLFGTLAATGAGVLTYLSQRDAATAFLAGGAAFAGAVLFFHTIIDS